jgi:hypothetical protein
MGIFENFQRKKRDPKSPIQKILFTQHFVYSSRPDNFGLVKFFQKCTVWEIASLAKNSKSGKMSEKGQSCHFQIVADFDWSIRLTI